MWQYFVCRTSRSIERLTKSLPDGTRRGARDRSGSSGDRRRPRRRSRPALEQLEVRTLLSGLGFPIEWHNFQNNLSDDTGNGNALSAIGQSPTYTAGVIGQAADVTSAPVHRTANGATGSNGELSFTVWINASNTNAALVTLEGNSAVVFGVELNADKARVLYNGGGTNTNVVVADNSWHHLVLTFSNTAPTANNGTIRLYVDGTQVYTASNLAPLNAYDKVLVGRNATAANDLSGLVDLFGLYASTLTSAEVTTLRNGGAGYDPMVPHAYPDTYSVIHDRTLAVTDPAQGVLNNDTDDQEDPLTAILVTSPNPQLGTLTVFNANGTFTYVPQPLKIGTDSFTYKVSDGVRESSPTTVTIHITDIAPVAVNSAYHNLATHPTAFSVAAPGVLASASDADGDAMRAILESGPSNAHSFSLNADGSFNYTPASGFTGVDSFRWKATDEILNSPPATVSLRVGSASQAAAQNVGVAPGIHLRYQYFATADPQSAWYLFRVLRPDTLTVAVNYDVTHGNLDLEVIKLGGGSVFGIDNSNGVSADVTVNPAAGSYDTYYVHVSGTLDVGYPFSLSIDPAASSSTVVYYVNDGSQAGDVYATAVGNDQNSGLTPDLPKATIQSVINTYTLGPTSHIAVDTGTYAGATVFTADDQGTALAGSPNASTFTNSGTAFEFSDSDSHLVYGMTFSGNARGVYAHPNENQNSRRNTVLKNTFTSVHLPVEIDGGDDDLVKENTITAAKTYGVYLPNTSTTVTTNVLANTITGIATESTQGIFGDGKFLIEGNTVSITDYGIAVAGNSAGTTIRANTVSSNTTDGYGIHVPVSDVHIYDNDVSTSNIGIYVNSDLVYQNTVHHNVVGIKGSGLIGGTAWVDPINFRLPNIIHDNTTGIVSLGNVTIQYNKIHRNAVGIEAETGDSIHHNLIYRNTAQGILIDAGNPVSVVNNTIYAVVGDGVRIRASSQNISLKNNIIWVRGGYGIYVATDSQRGFASDYNNLFSSDTGIPVWWQKNFQDVFDWQVEAAYDIHSIGYTTLDPTLDNPQFVDLAGDDYHLTDYLSTSIDSGDPASPFADEGTYRGARIDLGAYGGTNQASRPPDSYIRVDYPSFYTDWVYDVGHAIQWHTHNVTGNVNIALYNSTNTTLVADIGNSAASAGSFTWTPQNSNIPPDSSIRYKIRITSVNNSSVTAASREPFAVPSTSHGHFVNDEYVEGQDEYTFAAGWNRNTGRTNTDPKANLLPLLTNYDLNPGDTVYIDTGNYIHVRNVILSGDQVRGDDAGATYTGAVNHITTIDRQNTHAGSVVIDVYDASSVTMKYLRLKGGEVGLWVHHHSTRFTADYLTAHYNADDGIRIEADSDLTTVDHLTAHHNGGSGITIATPISSLSNSVAHNNGRDGMTAANAGRIVIQNNLAHHNGADGIWVTGTDSPDVLNNITHNNGGDGIGVTGVGTGEAYDNLTYNNGGNGFFFGGMSVAFVNENEAHHNGGNGFGFDHIGTLTANDNLSYENNGSGFAGSYVGATMLRDIAHHNGGDGFNYYRSSVLLQDSQSYYNGGNGVILIESGGLIGDDVPSTSAGVANHGNLIHHNGANGVFANGGLIAGNNIYSNTVDGIHLAGGEALYNDVYLNGALGIDTDPVYSGSVHYNRVYANANIGVRLISGAPAIGNVIYSNLLGILAEPGQGPNTSVITNNLIYSNTNGGIILHSGTSPRVTSNTVYQTTGNALDIDGGTRHISIRNNIFWVTSGYNIKVHSDSQVGFDSDYNDLYTTGTGKVAHWQGYVRSTLFAWQYTNLNDMHSFAQDPRFVDMDGTDGYLGYGINQATDGRDDDFHLQSQHGSRHLGSLAPIISPTTNLPYIENGTWTNDANQSPAIDRGDVASLFDKEPVSTGGYINVGHDGNTTQASRSPLSYVLIMRPDGGENWMKSQEFKILWRTVHEGEDNVFLHGNGDYARVPHSPTVSPSSITLEGWFRFYAPFNSTQVLISKANSNAQSYKVWYDGSKLRAAVGDSFGLENGLEYTWTPKSGYWYHIAFTYDQSTGAEALYLDGLDVNVKVQGTSTVSAISYDDQKPMVIGAELTGQNYGSFMFGMADEIRVWNSARTEAEIDSTIYKTLSSPTAGLNASYQLNGNANDSSGNANHGTLFGSPGFFPSTAPISSSTIQLSQDPNPNTPVYDITNPSDPVDTPNDTEYNWAIPAPDATPPLAGDYYMLITRRDDTAVFDTSNAIFSIYNEVHIYYVNDDVVQAGDWTTAPGDDGNSGLSPDSPKASIAAILYDYTLEAGDIIKVDSGHYILTTNTILDPSDNGYTIEGYHDAAYPTRIALLDRDNLNSERYALEFNGADNVTLDYLVFINANIAVYGNAGSSSEYITIRNSYFHDNVNAGVHLQSSNNYATFVSNRFEGDPMANGLFANADFATVTSNIVTGPIGQGLSINGNNALVNNNNVDNASSAISVTGANAVVRTNTITNSGSGISVSGESADVLSNTISDTGSGISVSGDDALVDLNMISNGGSGISVTGNNADVTRNTAAIVGSGISVTGSDMFVNENLTHSGSSGITVVGTGEVSENTAYNESSTGFSAHGSPLLVISNLAYDSGIGFFLGSGARATENVAHDNIEGFTTDYEYDTATIDHNRGYSNYGVGVHGRGLTYIDGNHLYHNGVGILGERGRGYIWWVGPITNNLVYASGTQGVMIHLGLDSEVRNNTLYEPTADGITVDDASVGVRLRNNIVWTQANHTISVEADSEIGFTSDYNVLYTTGSGMIGEWENDPFPTYLDWFYSIGQDIHSLNVDPLFVDPDGADNILGASTSTVGSAVTIDDSSSEGFSTQGDWTTHTTGGYNGNYRRSAAAANVRATYNFGNLVPAVYQIAATWPAQGDGLAKYSVVSGTWSDVEYVVDQTVASSGFSYGGVDWKMLGLIYVTGSSISVELSPGSGAPHAIVADGVWLQRVDLVDHGLDDNFHLQAASRAIDQGDPITPYLREPLTNGGRANIGYDGNTAQANVSPSPILQVLYPNGNEKLEREQSYTITWRSDGVVGPADHYTSAVTANNPIAYWRLNESAGPTADDLVGTLDGTYTATGVTYGVHGAVPSDSSTAVQLDGQAGAVTLPAGFANFQAGFSFEVWLYPMPGSFGEHILSLDSEPADLIQLSRDGDDLTFTVGSQSVQFADALPLYDWQHIVVTVDDMGAVTLYRNGQVFGTGTSAVPSNDSRTTNYLGRGQDGGYFSGAIDEAAIYATALSAASVQEHYNRRYFGTVKIELLENGNSTPHLLATGEPNDGAYTWTLAATLTLETTYEIRITSENAPAAVGVSNSPFLITNNGPSYYINDNSLNGDVYATAVGVDTNSGKLADKPMKTLAAMMDAYNLDTGDTIYVDAGTYRLYRAVLVKLEESGVHIVGPTTGTALNNRGNQNPLIYAFDFSGAANVLFDRLHVTGGRVGVYGHAPSATISNNTFYDSVDAGVYLGTASHNLTATGNTFYATVPNGQSIGLHAISNNASVTQNTVLGPPTYASTGTGLSIAGNDAYFSNNNVTGVGGSGIAVSGNSAEIRSNTVTSSGTGISVNGDSALVTLNTLTNDGTGIGITGDSAQVTSNIATSCGTGIAVTGGSALVNSNTVSTSGTGISVNGGDAQVTNNTLANDGTGVAVTGSNMTVSGNSAYGGSTGYSLNGSGIANNNLARDESSTGIYAIGDILVSSNTVYRNGTGIVVGSTARATLNVVHHNSVDGIATDFEYDTATVDHNRVFANVANGIHARGQTNVTGNTVYGDAVGILGEPGKNFPFVGTINNNLTYDNSNQSILIRSGSGAQVLNNTAYQLVGDAVRTDTTSVNIRVRNNILWVLRGYALYVTPESEIGFDSDYNLLYATSAGGQNGQIAWWEEDGFPTLASWFYGLGQDAHSTSADPLFIDMDGADNVLGYDPTPDGSPAQIIDDGDTAFSLTGTWSAQAGGHGGDYQRSDPADTSNLATYSFTGLTTGTYRLAGTWPASGGGNSARYTIYDGTQNIGTFSADQTLAPNDFTIDGTPWELLGDYYIAGTSITVELGAAFNGATVVADAVRLQRLGGDGGLDDNFHLQSTSPAIDRGDLSSAFANEPAPNGGRVNLGYDGNTAQTATSPNPLIQVLSPNNGSSDAAGEHYFEKFIQGQSITVTWRGTGLPAAATVDVTYWNGSIWQDIAQDVLFSAGSVPWTIPAGAATNDDYRVRVEYSATVFDESDHPFIVANSGHNYYINDGSTTGDVYTSAIGNDDNDGKSSSKPMRTLAALIDAYGPQAGDVIYVDTGSYRLHRNLVLAAQNRGIQILGPAGAGAVYDRRNYNPTRYSVEINGAPDVMIQNLTIKGGLYGIYTHHGADNSHLTVSGSTITDNLNGGILIQVGAEDATLDNNKLFATVGTPGIGQAFGINVAGVDRATVRGNTAYDLPQNIAVNSSSAIVTGNTSYNSAGATAIQVSGTNVLVSNNTAHHTATGIDVSGTGTVSGNTIYDVTGTGLAADNSGTLTVNGNTIYNADIGISLSDGVVASNNVVHHTNEGITTGNNATVRGNRIYAITGPGVRAAGSSLVDSNVIYNAQQGVLGVSGFAGTLQNNLIYANANEGIRLHGANGALIANNTIYQIVGDDIHIEQNSQNIRLRNNILYILAGYNLFFASDSQGGVDSDYNLFFLGDEPTPAAHLVYWDDQNIDLNTGPGHPLLNWWNATSPSQDTHSVYGNPLFVDINGTDNILGFTVAFGGYDGGRDDNFYLRPGSPAIDAGQATHAPATDILGYARIGATDIGTYEFRGSAGDSTPPTVTATVPAAIHTSGSLSLATIQVTFSEEINPIDATNIANYDLRTPGVDLIYHNGDDQVVSMSVAGYDPATFTVTLTITTPSSSLASGAYRFTVYSNNAGRGIRDASANWLDGDENASAGGDYIRNITIISDIRIQSFTGGGHNTVTVTYEVVHANTSAFDISFYRSANTLSDAGDLLLSTVQVTAPADLNVGVHTKSFTIGTGAGEVALPGTGGPDVDTDYFLLAVIDPADLVAEGDESGAINEDNTTAFVGAYHPAGSAVFVHGAQSADRARMITGTDVVVLRLNGSSSNNFTSDVSSFRVRLHEGNDAADGAGVSKPVLVWAGSGTSTFRGGSGNNTLYSPNSNNQWTVSASNGGTLNSSTFTSFQNLVGGSGSDVFTFSEGVSVSGSIDGGLGKNTFHLGAYTTAININLQTGSANAGALGGVTNIQNLIAGSGNDTIVGHPSGGYLVGGAGADSITGGAGRSVIIGGAGSDTLTSGASGDLLIAGTTDYDSNLSALDSILAEWSSAGSYATRIANLRAGTGLANGHTLVWGTTVQDDGVADTLVGSPDAAGDEFEWFFANLNEDTIQNLLEGEVVN